VRLTGDEVQGLIGLFGPELAHGVLPLAGVEGAAAVAVGDGIALKKDGSGAEGGHEVGGAGEQSAGEGEEEPARHIEKKSPRFARMAS